MLYFAIAPKIFHVSVQLQNFANNYKSISLSLLVHSYTVIKFACSFLHCQFQEKQIKNTNFFPFLLLQKHNTFLKQKAKVITKKKNKSYKIHNDIPLPLIYVYHYKNIYLQKCNFICFFLFFFFLSDHQIRNPSFFFLQNKMQNVKHKLRHCYFGNLESLDIKDSKNMNYLPTIKPYIYLKN